MGGSTRVRQLSASALRGRLADAVRPSIEALLLAAVALGCAQAGWTLLTPSTAGAVSNAAGEDANDAASLTVADIQSPFAPDATGMSAGSHAAAALLSSVQLNGIRMSEESARSGAMFTLGDGAQRAFLIGQEIAEGVTLADVSADHVLLSHEGGQHRLELAAAPTFSYARAFMGVEPAADVLTVAEAPVAAPVQVSESDRAWLMATLARVEIRAGRAYGWRIAEEMPEVARLAGLHPGDVVTSVNGAGPENLAAALTAAQLGGLALEVERGASRLTISIQADERT